MKKQQPKKRRKRSGLSDPGTRRRRSLSAGIMSGANLKNSAINTGLGALGGAAANVGNKLISGFKMGTVGKIITGAAIGFIGSALGAPKVSIGFTGGMTALALNAGPIAEDGEFAENDVLEEGEIFQTEQGDYVKVLSDGKMEYLSEEEIEALNDGNYPEYSTMNTFQN